MPYADPHIQAIAKKRNHLKNREHRLRLMRERYARNRADHIAAVTATRRKTRYGVTPTQFAEKFIAQGCKCGICKTKTPGKKGWHVDHDHKTGKFRGVLCHSCNCMLGFAYDDPKNLRRGANYLRRTQ